MHGLQTSGNYFELRKQHAFALNKAESIVRAAETAGRAMSETEQADFDLAMSAVRSLAPQLKAKEALNTVRVTDGSVVIDGKRHYHTETRRILSQEYAEAFYTYVRSGGKQITAALSEGAGGPEGGFIVPLQVEQEVVPLAPPDEGVRSVALVIPTVMDMKLPIKAGFGVTSAKAENAAFTETDPTLGQFTLSAFMAGNYQTVSWELMQDVPVFQQFVADDLITSQQIYEGAKYVTGSGTGEPQGLVGNVGSGVTEEPDAGGNLVSLSGILDLIGTLKTMYHKDAKFLMQRATSVIIRKAQVQANLFEPAWVRVGDKDFLYGYEVVYDSNMPAAARGAAPVLFGSFKSGYIIGDRGGSGINIKILDQPAALNGQLILLGYRRTDGRVRRSEAIQQYNVAAS